MNKAIGKAIAMTKKSNPLNIWDKEERRLFTIGEKNVPLTYLKWFSRCCKWSYQRVTKGFCDRDLWNMDIFFEDLIPAMLQKFKETRKGSPSRLGKEYVNEDGVSCNDMCHAEWDKVLDTMIFLWHEANEETCTQGNPFKIDKDKVYKVFRDVQLMAGLPKYKSHFKNYFEAERALERYRKECKDKALELLKEYWYDLWD